MTSSTTSAPDHATIAPEAGGARPELTAAHRCDYSSCGAQARAEVVTSSGGVLLFCMHHAEDLRASVEAAGGTVHTQYEGLSARPDVSA